MTIDGIFHGYECKSYFGRYIQEWDSVLVNGKCYTLTTYFIVKNKKI